MFLLVPPTVLVIIEVIFDFLDFLSFLKFIYTSFKRVSKADFLKAIFFARPIFLSESFAQTKWAKKQTNFPKNYPKKVKQW